VKILILGGTQEAIAAANYLQDHNHRVTTAMAGATRSPVRPKGKFITGGFGGPNGLSTYLTTNGIKLLIDATHPFAAKMSASAVVSAQKSRVPLIRLIRDPFEEREGANWLRVDGKSQAAKILPTGSAVFLTIGRKALEPFFKRKDLRYVMRSIEPVEFDLPKNFTAIHARPPFDVAGELALMKREGITHLVTKDSGGEQTSAKLEAAYMLRVQVVMISRPPLPPAREVSSLEELKQAIAQFPSPDNRFRFFPRLRKIWEKPES